MLRRTSGESLDNEDPFWIDFLEVELSPWHIVLVQDEVQPGGRLLEKVLELDPVDHWGVMPHRDWAVSSWIFPGSNHGGVSIVMGVTPK